MKKVKMLSLVLAAVVAVSVLSGCAKDNEQAKSGVTTVTIWTGGSSSFDVYKKLIDEWNNTEGKKINTEIDYQLKANETLQQTLEIALKAGNAPEFFFSGSMQALAEKGYLAAVEDLPGGDKILEKRSEYIQEENHKYNGKTYVVPVSTNLRGMIYNKDMFKAAGIVDENGEAKPPETFEEYRKDAKLLTNPDKGEYGAIYPMKWSDWLGSDVVTLNQSSVGHSGWNPVTGKYDYDGFAKTMQYLLDIYKDGSVYPDTEGLDNDTARALFAEGKIGIKMAYSFDVAVLNYQFPAKCDWGVAPLPVLDADNKYMQRMTYGTTPFINSSVLKDKAESAAAVLEFLTSDAFMIDLYKNGCEFPISYDLIKDVQLPDDAAHGWGEFGKMLEISRFPHGQPKTDTNSYKSIADRFSEEVWTGKKTPEEVTKQYEIDIQKAQDMYYEAHKDSNPEKYINKDWNIKR